MIDYLKKNHLSILIIGFLAVSSLFGQSVEETVKAVVKGIWEQSTGAPPQFPIRTLFRKA